MKKLFLFTVLLLINGAIILGQCVVCDQTPTAYGASIIGNNSTAEGPGSVAIGSNSNTSATGINSIAIGSKVETIAGLSMVIGVGPNATGERLINNIQKSLMIGFDSQYPTLFVSRPYVTSPNHTTTGRIGIGNITDPQSKLHLRSDEGEAANIFLEPSEWTNDFNAEIWMGNQLHGISADISKGLLFKTEHYYLFNQGNMGLGTEEPAAKVHVKSGDIYIEDIDRGIIMKSPDGTCWRGTVNNDGQIVFEALDICPEDGTTSVSEPSPIPSNIKVYPNPAENQITIEISKLSFNSLNLEIIDEIGRIAKSSIINNNQTVISIEDLQPGIYYCRVSGDQTFGVEKFIKH